MSNELIGALELEKREVTHLAPKLAGIVKKKLFIHEQSYDEFIRCRTKDKESNGNFELLIDCLKDEDGNTLFGIDELPTLKAKGGFWLSRLLKVALEINSLMDNEEGHLKNEPGTVPSTEQPAIVG